VRNEQMAAAATPSARAAAQAGKVAGAEASARVGQHLKTFLKVADGIGQVEASRPTCEGVYGACT
jgi:hypothetical protein